jgi:hypothetical protein
MPSELKFAVLFEAIDKISDVASTIGALFTSMAKRADAAAEDVRRLRERLVSFDERASLAAALVSEGTETLHNWSEAITEPAIAIEQAMAPMAALTSVGAAQLHEIKQRAIKFSSSHPGVTAEQWADSFTRLRNVFQNTAQAIAREDIAGMLTRLCVDGTTAGKLPGSMWANLNAGSRKTGDQLTRTIQLSGLVFAEVNQFAMAAGRLGASAAAALAPFSEALAPSGEANRLLAGGRGSTMVVPTIQRLQVAIAKNKATSDFSHALIDVQRLKSPVSGTNLDKLGQLQAMGLRQEEPQLLKLLDNINEVAARQKQIGDWAGALSRGYGSATDNMAGATTRLPQTWSNLADAFSRPTLKIQGENWFGDQLPHATNYLDRHSLVAGTASLALTAIGGAAYHRRQALSALGTMSVFAGRGFQTIQFAAKALDFESMALRFMYLKDAIGGIANLTMLPSAAQTVLDLAVSPMFLTPAAVVAIGVAAHEPYKQKNAGLNMMKSLGEGMLAGIEWPFKAAESVAARIGGFFHFHSPPAYGPLREAILNFHLGKELATHIKAASAITAAEHAALPLARSFATEGKGQGAPSVTVNVNYTVNAASPQEWVKAARQHADELMRIIDTKLSRRARLEFA